MSSKNFADMQNGFTILLFADAVVFCCLCRMISIMLKCLNQEISAESADPAKCLDKWQDCYHLISDLARALERCFGFLLLVCTAYTFVWMVNSSFYCLNGFTQPDFSSYDISIAFATFVATFVFFVYLAYEANHLKHQVRQLIPYLRDQNF